jgi:high-affinity iron transporter
MMTRLLVALLLLTSIPSVALAGRPDAEDARRLTAILDYVAADYGGAVRDGRVVSETEYAEQVGFLDDAATLAARLPLSPADAVDRVSSLRAAVARHEAPEAVAEACRQLRADVATTYGVVMAPSARLSREDGERLYASECASCHGVTGGADTPIAATLTPAPRNFRDRAIMSDLTPARAYNVTPHPSPEAAPT